WPRHWKPDRESLDWTEMRYDPGRAAEPFRTLSSLQLACRAPGKKSRGSDVAGFSPVPAALRFPTAKPRRSRSCFFRSLTTQTTQRGQRRPASECGFEERLPQELRPPED